MHPSYNPLTSSTRRGIKQNPAIAPYRLACAAAEETEVRDISTMREACRLAKAARARSGRPVNVVDATEEVVAEF